MRYDPRVRVGAEIVVMTLAALSGCSGNDRVAVSVDVRTDLRPGTEFVSVETRAAHEPIGSASAPETIVLDDLAGADFIAGHRVAELEDLPHGTLYIEVRLIGTSGETLLSRTTILEVTANYAVTLVLSRTCAGVLCPAEGDPPDFSACVGGRCVDPRCTVEDTTYCGEPQCTADDACPADGCRAGVCSDRVCLLSPDDGRCAAGETCRPDGSCAPAVVDSGVPTDTGPADTAVADTAVADTRPATTGSFCPDDPVLRQHMAHFLVVYMHGPEYRAPAATGVFSDVPISSPFAPEIEQIARDGITSGCGGDRFCPTDPVLRDQAASFLVRARYGPGYSPPAPTGVFTDVPAGNVHAAAIEQIYRDGITRGCGTNRYCPSDPLLRRHLAVFLVRLIYGGSFSPPPAVGLFDDVDPSEPEAPYIEQLAIDGFTRGC
jgi:hypothetical protein